MLKPITRPLPRSADTNGARRAPFTWSSATVRWRGHGRGMVKKTWGGAGHGRRAHIRGGVRREWVGRLGACSPHKGADQRWTRGLS